MHSKVEQLLKIPQFEQRSPEWFEQRNNAITASDIPTVLGENNYKTPLSLLIDKCAANPKPFVGNAATKWGTHYEDIAIEKYSELRGKEVLSFGLLIHPEYSWLGGSPDGITTDGILLEVKCPLKRKIVMGEVPHHYLSQVLLNLEICDLELAHFIEFIPGNADDDYIINIVEVKRDREWFANELPKMKAFWDSVLESREKGIDTNKEYRDYRVRCEKRKKKEPLAGQTLNLNVVQNKCLFIETEETEEPEEEVTIIKKVHKAPQPNKCLFIEE
jgi:putative phage-type endonuclease